MIFFFYSLVACIILPPFSLSLIVRPSKYTHHLFPIHHSPVSTIISHTPWQGKYAQLHSFIHYSLVCSLTRLQKHWLFRDHSIYFVFFQNQTFIHVFESLLFKYSIIVLLCLVISQSSSAPLHERNNKTKQNKEKIKQKLCLILNDIVI